MKLKNTLLAVSDMDRSLEFYSKLLGLSVELDFGANKTLTGGLVLQTLDTWQSFLGTKSVSFGGNAAELYFEEEDFDAFLRKLDTCAVDFVHPPKEHSWGQRVVRFYDLDGNLIEVGEITDFIDIPNNPCIEVETENGAVMIPLHQDLILSVDPENQEIIMQIPAGLL